MSGFNVCEKGDRLLYFELSGLFTSGSCRRKVAKTLRVRHQPITNEEIAGDDFLVMSRHSSAEPITQDSRPAPGPTRDVKSFKLPRKLGQGRIKREPGRPTMILRVEGSEIPRL